MYLVDEMIEDRDFTKATPILTVNTVKDSYDNTYTLDNVVKGRYFYFVKLLTDEMLTDPYYKKYGNLEAKEIQLLTIQ